MNIIVIEDDPDLLDSITMLLNQAGFPTDGVRSIAAFNFWQRNHQFDLVILDRMLPDGDGLDLVADLKKTKDTPIIVLSGMTNTESRIEGINADVNHYLNKPVDSDELLALVKSCQRKLNPSNTSQWLLNKVTWEFSASNSPPFKLTNNEFKLMSVFTGKAGLVISREDLAIGLDQDPEIYDYRRMEVLIKRLRKKFSDSGYDCPIQNIYGSGYSFNEPINWKKET